MNLGDSETWLLEEEADDGSVTERGVSVHYLQSNMDGAPRFMVSLPNGARRVTSARHPREAIAEVASSERWRLVSLTAPGQAKTAARASAKVAHEAALQRHLLREELALLEAHASRAAHEPTADDSLRAVLAVAVSIIGRREILRRLDGLGE